MRRDFCCVAVSIFFCSLGVAQENTTISNAFLPANPAANFIASPTPGVTFREPSEHSPLIDRQFFIFSTISTAAIFADSYTTTWIGNNYRSRGPGPCTVEGGEPRLYGLHPTIARSYEVAAGMSAGAIAASYLARKYLPSKMKWMWPSAFIYETGVSLHGFSTNLRRC